MKEEDPDPLKNVPPLGKFGARDAFLPTLPPPTKDPSALKNAIFNLKV